MPSNDKETIYVDVDDEITGIIDKVRTSNQKVVALVLPKRAATFQSIVNMKLLKRAADSSKKNLVLITSEAGLLPLAGAAGVHVAKTLNSKPEIPTAPGVAEDEEESIDSDGAPAEPDPGQPVGELADSHAMSDGMETLELDDEDLPPEAKPSSKKPKTFEPPAKKKKGLRVPNFERFRLLLILGGILLVLGIGGAIFAAVALPKATISIKTNATTVDVEQDLNLSTTATTVKASTGTVPAKMVQQQKTFSQQVPTTGQKNNGNRASGTVVLVNCSETSDSTVPAGTGLSSGGNTYITQQTVTVPVSNFKKKECQKDGTASVTVVAQNPGSAYNGANSFSVAGFGNLSGNATGQVSGGTDNIVQTVNQNDINNAKAKISANDAEVKQALQSQLQGEGLEPLDVTYAAGTPRTTTSANVGDVANSVTVTETISYSMFGAKEDDLKALVEANIREQIDEEQSILDNGLKAAKYKLDKISATTASILLTATATAGPDLSVDEIKEQAAGKKPGLVKQEIGDNPDVTEVNVDLSPFWVSNIPSKTDRIKVEIAKPTKDSNTDNSDGSDR